MKIKIYVEGGGNTRRQQSGCRQGFRTFLQKAGVRDRSFSVHACGGRQVAYDDFCIALKNAADDEFIVLLVDSEAAVAAPDDPWPHLKARDNWDKPATATDDKVHLMVQCMEAWFIADRDTLNAFFGQQFNANALPARNDVENISKQDLYTGLESATRRCEKKGKYGKGRHSFDILAQIDPAKVMAASPYAQRLIDTLRAKA